MTKKVGITGKYGPRYGTKTKKVVLEIEEKRKKEKTCPYCERHALKRIAAGIWYCKKCKIKFAGGAYFPKSDQNV
ncbi:MAG: 50S ribosomal protein L37ae [Candidatus Aenigmatarchaeota archaeon]